MCCYCWCGGGSERKLHTVNRLFYICNALDDTTRLERGIVTDSPAASRKIFLICQAMRKAGVRPLVISLGRGRQDGSGRYFKSKVCRVNGIPVIYLPFLHWPVLSELLSLFSIIPILWRTRLLHGVKAALFYNRMPAFLFGVVIARVLRFRTVLDLEDGEVNLDKLSFRSVKWRVFNWFFDSFCKNGALLACDALKDMTRLRPICCCYGTCEAHPALPRQSIFPVTVLFGGTVSLDTGAQLLLDTINALRKESPSWAKNIQFEISGKGDSVAQFELLVDGIRHPKVIVHGRLTDDEYKQLLARTHVGLALKPNAGAFAYTTFPSKVIEFASHGILVVTTDISDVRKIFTDGAIYLTEDDASQLMDELRWIVEQCEAASDLASRGHHAVADLCSPPNVAQTLKSFIFDS